MSTGRLGLDIFSESRVPAVRVELALLALECLWRGSDNSGGELLVGEGGRRALLSGGGGVVSVFGESLVGVTAALLVLGCNEKIVFP